jgi:ribosomal protein S27AE
MNKIKIDNNQCPKCGNELIKTISMVGSHRIIQYFCKESNDFISEESVCTVCGQTDGINGCCCT